LHCETPAPPAAGNHGSTESSVQGPLISRTFHTLATNRNCFHLQQHRRLKGSLATDGSTLFAETSKSVTSSDRTGKDSEIDVQMKSASSNDSSTSQLRKDVKKVDNISKVSILSNFTFFTDSLYVKFSWMTRFGAGFVIAVYK